MVGSLFTVISLITHSRKGNHLHYHKMLAWKQAVKEESWLPGHRLLCKWGSTGQRLTILLLAHYQLTSVALRSVLTFSRKVSTVLCVSARSNASWSQLTNSHTSYTSASQITWDRKHLESLLSIQRCDSSMKPIQNKSEVSEAILFSSPSSLESLQPSVPSMLLWCWNCTLPSFKTLAASWKMQTNSCLAKPIISIAFWR